MLIQRPIADDDEKQAAELLLAHCDVSERLELPVVIPQPGVLPEGGIAPFIWLEDGRLIGLLVLEGWPIPEGTPIVLPEYRRRGVGKQLALAATTACRDRGGKRWHMVGDAESAGSALFAETIGARYDSSEYRMDLDRSFLPGPPQPIDGVDREEIRAEKLDHFSRALALAFEDPLDQVRRWSAEQLELPNVRLFVASAGSTPIATARLITIGFHAYVTALGVIRPFRRRGIGRWLVLQSIHDLIAEGWEKIRIEVDTTNEAAYQLYRSCGFRETRTYRFYELLTNH